MDTDEHKKTKTKTNERMERGKWQTNYSMSMSSLMTVDYRN